MAEMGLEGLKSRKSGIWGQNNVVLVHQRVFFFFKLKVQLKTLFWSLLQKKDP